MIVKIFGDFFGAVIFFGIFLVTIAMKNIYLFVFFSGIIFFAYVIFIKYSHLQLKRRKEVKEIHIERQRTEVKRFMSKNEIMQQNKVDEELKKKQEIHKRRTGKKKKEKMIQ